jgi:hypothetical protein
VNRFAAVDYLVNKQQLTTKNGRAARIAGPGDYLKGKTSEVYHNSTGGGVVRTINLQTRCSEHI